MHVAYAPGMLGGRIDREAWAREVDALVVRFDPGPRGEGNKSAFARRINMTRKTLERWAAHASDVNPESVRAIAERLQLTQQEQIDLLTRIGYLTPDMPVPPVVADPREDPLIRQILADDHLDEDQRAELVQLQLDRIAADLARRRAEYEQLRKHLLGRRDAS